MNSEEDIKLIQEESELDLDADTHEYTEEEVQEAIKQIQGNMSKKFIEFTFPLAVSGEDPENPEEQLTRLVYPTLRFRKPSSGRDVRRAIKKFIKLRYKQKPNNEQLHDIFNLGIELMYRTRVEAQMALNRADENEMQKVVQRAQTYSEEIYDKDKENLV